jgi:hypothetical protein
MRHACAGTRSGAGGGCRRRPPSNHAGRPDAPRAGAAAWHELAAVQRILTGDQYMTVYKAIKPEAEGATIGQMISDGFLKASGICSGSAASACRQVGLSQ